MVSGCVWTPHHPHLTSVKGLVVSHPIRYTELAIHGVLSSQSPTSSENGPLSLWGAVSHFYSTLSGTGISVRGV